ncbi:MAG TPA: hypothetical protein VIY29_26880, partial [Ktedonobacteraceae bacterium]
EQSMAESEEGRPLIKENIHQSSTCPTQSGACVSQGLAGVRKGVKRGRVVELHELDGGGDHSREQGDGVQTP